MGREEGERRVSRELALRDGKGGRRGRRITR